MVSNGEFFLNGDVSYNRRFSTTKNLCEKCVILHFDHLLRREGSCTPDINTFLNGLLCDKKNEASFPKFVRKFFINFWVQNRKIKISITGPI